MIRPIDAVYAVFHTAKGRSRRSGTPFDITLEYVQTLFKAAVYCPVLGLKLARSSLAKQDNSPSLDRLDNTKGYIMGNVVVISWRANRLKTDATYQELRFVADWLEHQITGELPSKVRRTATQRVLDLEAHVIANAPRPLTPEECLDYLEPLR